MAGRAPGTRCVTTEPPLDAGTSALTCTPAPCPLGIEPPVHAETAKLAAQSKASVRLTENRRYLADANVKAFLAAIAVAEGGDYDLKFGGVKGKRNDKWKFTDTTTHPGTGADGKTTAAGMYQINIATWKEMGAKMGLTDFSAETQDLLAVEILRSIRAIDSIVAGDVDAALSIASRRWAALPEGPDKPGRYAQPFLNDKDFLIAYKAAGGTTR